MSEGPRRTGATTVTVLFTDLVASTALFSRIGPQRAEALYTEHIRQLGNAVSDHGGVITKDVGDGIMAVFGGVESGLDAAVTIQQAVERHNQTGGEHIGIRVGVATGEAMEDHGDYHGESVVEAARVCAIAEGGQILATEAVRFLARRTAHRFAALGERMLKGLPEPVSVLEVRWDPIRERALIPLPPRLAGPHAAAFVGRLAQRSVLEKALSRAWAGARHVVFVGGEPGVGKTRLCTDLAAAASGMGAAVLYGRCDEELRRPYQPWVEAVGHLVAHGPSEVLGTYLTQHSGELVRLLPDLVTGDDAAHSLGSRDPETERYRLWGAIAGLFALASADAPVVLVLDDLQWADRETLQLLRHLFTVDSQMRLLVLATYRDTEVRPGHPLADLVAWLRREPVSDDVQLTGLAQSEIVDLMEQLAGHKMEPDGIALATALWQETDGNPFFAGELLRHLSETDAITQGTNGRWVAQPTLDPGRLPASVREVIGHRVGRLGAEAEQILGVAAVIGHNFDLRTVAAVAGVDEDDVLDVLERAGAAALVSEVAETPGRFGFNHVLIQHTLYGGLSATRRRSLHLRVAETLEGVCGDEPGERVGELARHWVAVATPTEADKAIHYASLAGDSALRSLGPDEALRWYSQALELVGEGDEPDDAIRCQLLLNLGVAQRQSGDPAYRETLLEAGRRARNLGDKRLVVRAALAVHRGFYASSRQIDDERVALLEAALDMSGGDDTPDRARLLATLASELTFHSDHTRRKALAREAVAVARRTNDKAALVDALCVPRLALHIPDTLEERLVQTAEAVALADRLGDPAARFWAYHTRRYPLLMSGDIDEADRCLTESQNLVAQIGQPALAWSLTLYLAVRALHAGDADGAERLAQEALNLATDTGQPDVSTVYGTQMLWIRWHQGRLGELIPRLEELRAANPQNRSLPGALAMAYSDVDDSAAATRLLEVAKKTQFELSYDYIWLMTMAYWAQTSAEVGDVEASEILYYRLLPWHDRVGFTGVSVTGAVAYYLGRLAVVRGRIEEANAHFGEALAIHERLRAPFFIAQTKLGWGRLLRSTDSGRADDLLRSARDVAVQHGCARVERLANEALSGVAPADS